jgi:hypothetical protein
MLSSQAIALLPSDCHLIALSLFFFQQKWVLAKVLTGPRCLGVCPGKHGEH